MKKVITFFRNVYLCVQQTWNDVTYLLYAIFVIPVVCLSRIFNDNDIK